MLLKTFATMALTTRIYYPYRGTAVSEFEKYVRALSQTGRHADVRQKHMLAVFRLLMAGIFVLETGKIEPNMTKLCGYFDDKEVLKLATSQMINGDRNGFKVAEIEKYVDMMENYFLHIDLAAQESTALFRDDGTADQKQRAALKEGIFFAANDLLKKTRMQNSE